MRFKKEWKLQTPILFLLQILFCSTVVGASENNMHLYGSLVANPCTIAPGDENIELNFGSVIDNYIYQNTRTPGQPFEIHLMDCDLSLGNMVTITFTGTESTMLQGLLAIDESSEAQGIAIGIETKSSVLLPLNKASSQYTLQNGQSVIALKAFVQGEPSAISERRVTHGAFRAVATFRLDYE